jgi:hypothetical protein
MAQSLELNIKTTSDVPKAMDKAKQATDGFGKQVQGIQKKFSMAFKDIFLSFLGPMALLGAALNYISKLIEENQRKRAEANQAAIDGTNELMSAEDRYWANRRNNEKTSTEKKEQAQLGREEVTRQFTIIERERAFKAMSPEQQLSLQTGGNLNDIIRDPEYQKRIQALISEDMKKNPLPVQDSKNTSANFKGPEGFSNVVGVGANPVIEAMNAQLEATQETNAILREIANGGGASTDFTKANSSPSRASLLIR